MGDFMIKYQELWNSVLDKLSQNYAPQTFEQTFGEVKKVVKFENGILSVLTPYRRIKTSINNVYYKNIESIISKLTSEKIRIKFICEDEITVNKTVPAFTQFSKNNLNLNFTFESLVVDDFNRMGYLTGLKVADNPGTFVNPLYIFGSVGLGKTHLMQAIGNYISETNLDYKIVYVQANDYLVDYTRATRDNNMLAFEEKYGNIDVLLVDDIQMLTDKTGTQQEFFKLFNEMTNNNKQIVITSDCPASKLNGFMDRLTSRFQMGVTVDIKQPDQNQRVKILKRKIEETTDKKIDEDVIEYIAEKFTDNVRELEGALQRILLYSEFQFTDSIDTNINLKIAKEALDVLIKSKKPVKNNNYENALSVIASMYNINVVDIIGSSRNSKYVLPRHIAMYILKTKYDLTFSKIGKILNGRDHTTIMNGYNKIASELETNEQLKMAIEAIMKKV